MCISISIFDSLLTYLVLVCYLLSPLISPSQKRGCFVFSNDALIAESVKVLIYTAHSLPYDVNV